MKTVQFKQQQTTMWQICRNDVVRFERREHDNRRALTLGESTA